MKGSYTVSIQNNRVKYEFTIRRNITIIQGNSATGKTTLVDMIREHQLNGSDSGISLSCKKKCAVLEGQNWEAELSLIKESIVFIDEGNKFIVSTDFAAKIKNTDNYYVLITREDIEPLPYSINEIYGIHTSGKYADLKQIYHEFYPIYKNEKIENKTGIKRILTEDSNSGYDFFKYISQNKYSCESAKGKSNIFKKLCETPDTTLVIADGAAFGSQMSRIIQIISEKNNCILFLPESFEYLLLSSEIINDKELSSILFNPSDFIESSDYFSWEQFFTSLLVDKTKKTYLKYSKKKINENYLSEKIVSKILNSKVFSNIKDLFL